MQGFPKLLRYGYILSSVAHCQLHEHSTTSAKLLCAATPLTTPRVNLIDASRSELVCRPAHALQALYKGMILAHPALWTAVHEENLSKFYADLIPTPRHVWQLLSTFCF